MRVMIDATGCPAPVSDRTVPDGLDGRAPARRHLSLRLSTSLLFHKLTFSLSNIPSTGGAAIMSLVSQEEMWNSSRLRMTTQRRAMASRCLH